MYRLPFMQTYKVQLRTIYNNEILMGHPQVKPTCSCRIKYLGFNGMKQLPYPE